MEVIRLQNTEKLKPCPFCGGEAGFKIFNTIMQANNRGWSYELKCKKCGVSVPNIERYETIVGMNENGDVLIIHDDRKKVIEAWNRRVNDGKTD
mgnify:CR=1 FL=1|jgi:Lar family restriction alleviation protein